MPLFFYFPFFGGVNFGLRDKISPFSSPSPQEAICWKGISYPRTDAKPGYNKGDISQTYHIGKEQILCTKTKDFSLSFVYCHYCQCDILQDVKMRHVTFSVTRKGLQNFAKLLLHRKEPIIGKFQSTSERVREVKCG